MAIYKFTEVDNTRVSTVKNDNSNYVFLPINSTWGPSDKPVAIQSLAELKEYLGEDAEAGSGGTTITSYQYATDIIKSGFCVLAKRLVSEGTNEGASKPAKQKEYKKIRLNYGRTDQTVEIEVGTTKEETFGENSPILFTGNEAKTEYTYTAKPEQKPKSDSYELSFHITTDGVDDSNYEFSYSDGIYTLKRKTGSEEQYTKIEAQFTVTSNFNNGLEAMYYGTFGNNLKSSLSTKLYGSNQKLLIMSTYNTVDGSKLEETPLGMIKIGTTKADDVFTSVNVVSDYIKIKEDGVSVDFSSKTATESKYNNIYFGEGTDISRESAISLAASVYSCKQMPSGELIDNDLANKWLYDIKFLCNGGLIGDYDNATNMASNMIDLANERQDCIAFIDSQKCNSNTSTEDFFSNINNKSTYAAAYAPWCTGTVIGSTTVIDIPASYYVITSMAKSFSAGNNVCLPPAGVNRGIVNIKQPAFNIGNVIMEKWQGNTGEMTFCINPIMNVRKYGYCIFGQRNLYELPYGTSSALQEVGVRLTLNEVKKWVRDVAVSLTFESNTNRTWNEFVSKVQKCLDKLVADGLLTQYSIERNSDITDQINTNTLSATIRVYVTRALENFDITVEVNSGDITFDEAYTG